MAWETNKDMQFNWFDIFLAVVLIAGLVRGKKRGMSEELLDVGQWLCVIVLCGLLYQPLGSFLADYTKMSLMWGFLVGYLAIFVVIKLIFTSIKRAVGEKLMHADAFGKMEYYLGMLAGALRFACILLMGLALLNAKYISEAERARIDKVQADNFGSGISFPTIGSLQKNIFYQSPSGRFIKENFGGQLIEGVPPGQKVRRITPLDEVLTK